MKKIIVFILALFVLTPIAFAEGNISRVDVNVLIDENGETTFSEKWVVEKQNISYLERRFSDTGDVTISDISVISNRGIEIKKTDKWNRNIPNTFYLNEDQDKSKLFVSIDGEADIYIITYKVKGFIVNFDDVQGIEWYFLSRNGNQNIELFTAHIMSKINQFDETNTALYVVGGNNLEASFVDGEIYLHAKNVRNNYPIKLMTTFNGINFENAIKKNMSFEERYQHERNSTNITAELINLVSNEIFIVIISIFGIIILLLVIRNVFKSLKKHDEYYGIEVYDKNAYEKIANADYYDATPCNGDLYKIAFIAGYFKLLKNRSNLIGAIILKWDFENYVEIVPNPDNPFIKIKTGQYFESSLDYDLYNILSSAATQGNLSGSKLTRYAQDHYLRVMAWFNLGHHDTINNELNREHIKRVKKLKKYEYVLQESIVDDAVKLAGLKKYLLHFNQVPRQTQLTNEGYKYLLILAELFGIGEQVSKEILRKNPDNEMAKKLASLQGMKHIYKDVYSAALGPYKQVVKDKRDVSSYDPEIEQIITRENDAASTRRL